MLNRKDLTPEQERAYRDLYRILNPHGEGIYPDCVCPRVEFPIGEFSQQELNYNPKDYFGKEDRN